jgi:hypothetical protein
MSDTPLASCGDINKGTPHVLKVGDPKHFRYTKDSRRFKLLDDDNFVDQSVSL